MPASIPWKAKRAVWPEPGALCGPAASLAPLWLSCSLDLVVDRCTEHSDYIVASDQVRDRMTDQYHQSSNTSKHLHISASLVLNLNLRETNLNRNDTEPLPWFAWKAKRAVWPERGALCGPAASFAPCGCRAPSTSSSTKFNKHRRPICWETCLAESLSAVWSDAAPGSDWCALRHPVIVRLLPPEPSPYCGHPMPRKASRCHHQASTRRICSA